MQRFFKSARTLCSQLSKKSSTKSMIMQRKSKESSLFRMLRLFQLNKEKEKMHYSSQALSILDYKHRKSHH